MTTFSVCDRPVNVKPAPVRSIVVLFDGGARRTVPGFGRGVLRSLLSYRTPFTADDAAWAARAFNAVDAGGEPVALSDAELDQMAEWSAATDRLSRGLCL